LERFSLALEAPFHTSAAVFSQRELALITVFGEDGTVGHGEVTPLEELNGISIEDACDALSGGTLDALVGLEPEALASELERLGARLPACAYAGLEAALCDLEARSLKLPLAQMINPQAAASVPVNAVISVQDPSDVAAAGERALDAGFSTVKLKVGFSDDRQRVEALRTAVGSEMHIRLDANGAWQVEEATEKINVLAEFRLELIEQPVAADDVAGMSRVREATAVPVVADEGVRTVAQLQHHVELAACDGIAVKLAPSGGLTRAWELVGLARKAGIFAVVTSSLDGPVGLATSVHFAAAVNDASLAHGLATADAYEDAAMPAWLTPSNGCITLPELSGNGIN
ncbi:MAG: hypothetical protein JHC87_07935, partial [Thermoleophilaceae bacterium]|nr:hypothetical protein [Thermoleophilaceae bacterium]